MLGGCIQVEKRCLNFEEDSKKKFEEGERSQVVYLFCKFGGNGGVNRRNSGPSPHASWIFILIGKIRESYPY